MTDVRVFARKDEIETTEEEIPSFGDGEDGWTTEYEIRVHSDARVFIRYADTLGKAEEIAFQLMSTRVYMEVDHEGNAEYFPVNKVRIMETGEPEQ